MEIPFAQLPPGDTRIVDAIVNQLKSRGIFDKFRKECLADVDTKPAFQNLRQRVDGHVKKFLGTKNWKSDMNKNQIRDGVRKDIQESGILDAGIDAIINQVVNPKITPLILPYVEDTVYAYLQIEKPKREPEDDQKYGESGANIPHMQYNQNPVPYRGLPPHLQKNVYSVPTDAFSPTIKSEPLNGKTTEIKIEEAKSKIEVTPMATDTISSEEDEDLLYANRTTVTSRPDTTHQHQNPSDVKMEEDNAVDSFDFAFKDCDAVVASVEKLSIKESESYSSVSKLGGVDQKVIFDQQSLDSISSNSSNLSFCALNQQHAAIVKADVEDSVKDDVSMDELRSSQSTPLEDEKSVSSHTSTELGEWGGSALPKDLPSAERITIASFNEFESRENRPMLVSGASPVSTESQSSLGTSQPKYTSEATEDSPDSMSLQKLGLDEVSSNTSNSSSRHSTPRDMDSTSEKGHSSKSNSTDGKSKSRSHHDRKRSDSKYNRDKHHHSSKSRDDHSSHRKKDTYRRDRDDDSDEDRRSKSRYHSSTSRHSSSHHSHKDRREKSSGHSSHHKSDNHGHRHKSDHHRSHSHRENSSHRDGKEHRSKDDRQDKKKSSDSSNNNKDVSKIKINGTKTSIRHTVNNISSTDKKSLDKSVKTGTRRDPTETSKGNNLASANDSKRKRNGSFSEVKKGLVNGTKESRNLNKIDKPKDGVVNNHQNPKKLLALEEDITLMGNLNRKKQLLNKVSREPNNNNTKNVTKLDNKGDNKEIKNSEYKNGKKLKENKDEGSITKLEKKSIVKEIDSRKIKFEKSPNLKLNTPKLIKNGQNDALVKKTLRISLEDISLQPPNSKRRKIEHPVILPPTNSQRLVICSFKTQPKILDQVSLDDSDDGSDFEGFEPPPKRICMETSDMFSESEATLFDFEGFPDSNSTSSGNRIRNYLSRMNHTGHCSRYSD